MLSSMITYTLETLKIFYKCTQTSSLRNLEWTKIQKEFFKAEELIKNQQKSRRKMRLNLCKSNNNKRISFLKRQANWGLQGLYIKKHSHLLIKMEIFKEFKSLLKEVALNFLQLISIIWIISEAVSFPNIKILKTWILFLEAVYIKVKNS
jgi:hypothetical protein